MWKFKGGVKPAAIILPSEDGLVWYDGEFMPKEPAESVTVEGPDDSGVRKMALHYPDGSTRISYWGQKSWDSFQEMLRNQHER